MKACNQPSTWICRQYGVAPITSRTTGVRSGHRKQRSHHDAEFHKGMAVEELSRWPSQQFRPLPRALAHSPRGLCQMGVLPITILKRVLSGDPFDEVTDGGLC
jgi:hypothetical protein